MKTHQYPKIVKWGSWFSPHNYFWNNCVVAQLGLGLAFLPPEANTLYSLHLWTSTFETAKNIWLKHLKKTNITEVKDKPYWELNFGDELKILQYHKQQLWLCIIWVDLQEASSTDSTVFSSVLRFNALLRPLRSLSDSADCDTGFIAHLVLQQYSYIGPPQNLSLSEIDTKLTRTKTGDHWWTTKHIVNNSHMRCERPKASTYF